MLSDRDRDGRRSEGGIIEKEEKVQQRVRLYGVDHLKEVKKDKDARVQVRGRWRMLQYCKLNAVPRPAFLRWKHATKQFCIYLIVLFKLCLSSTNKMSEWDAILINEFTRVKSCWMPLVIVVVVMVAAASLKRAHKEVFVRFESLSFLSPKEFLLIWQHFLICILWKFCVLYLNLTGCLSFRYWKSSVSFHIWL